MFAKGKGEVSLARGLNRMDLSKAPSYFSSKITAAHKMTKRTLTHSGRNLHKRTRNYFPKQHLELPLLYGFVMIHYFYHEKKKNNKKKTTMLMCDIRARC